MNQHIGDSRTGVSTCKFPFMSVILVWKIKDKMNHFLKKNVMRGHSKSTFVEEGRGVIEK